MECERTCFESLYSHSYIESCLSSSFYEDLFDLVKHLPNYHVFPSGIPPPHLAFEQALLEEQFDSGKRRRVSDTPARRNSFSASLRHRATSSNGTQTSTTSHSDPTDDQHHCAPDDFASSVSRPKLRPARNPPKTSWAQMFAETVPLKYLPWARNRRRRRLLKEMTYGYGSIGSEMDEQKSIPLELTVYMVCQVDCQVSHQWDSTLSAQKLKHDLCAFHSLSLHMFRSCKNARRLICQLSVR